ncbi:CBL-interacting protein kinase 2 [Carica papaya]|uniref:CBL-interacting protein kinase 2 n=1 Tax=Carica papaya TaxID=3649 RepID=UPI000B8D01FC|nr:CBL-interacting protein kinase 2 [Carica papaya]
MEQFRQIGEVLGSLNALMVLQDDIKINQRQCSLLLEIFTLAFNTIADAIRQNLNLEEKNTKWRDLEQPLRELYRVFKEGELYVRYCIDNRDWWGKLINLHQNKDSIEFHIHNLLCYFPAVIEAIETAGEISGLDPAEMQSRRVALKRKYDKEWIDPKLFQWRYGRQYLVPREICSRFEISWREDKWHLLDVLQEKRNLLGDASTKIDKRFADLLFKKIAGMDPGNGKLFPSSILVGGKDYQVKQRLGGGSQYKAIQWLGENFALRHFFGEIEPLSSEISTLLSLCHPNILQYLCGFYDEERKECFLVMELMHKDLLSYMKENSGPRRRFLFSLPVVVDLMLQIARGMEYLHSRNTCHGDLNPCNILLKERSWTDGYFHAKISGFGLSSIKTHISRNSTKQHVSNPFIWYAPEVLEELEHEPESIPSSKHTQKADVYSFAMVCFELLTGKLPFEDGHLQGEKMTKNIRAGERPLFPFPSPKYLADLTRRCWHSDPNQRPSFSSICRILRYIKKFLVMNPDNGLPELQSPLVDYYDLEARFLKKFPAECNSFPASVTQIPFQMFAYKVIEKEKTNPKSNDNNLEAASDVASDIFSVVEDPPVVPRDAKSMCVDRKSVCSDTRSVFSEAPDKKILKLKKISFLYVLNIYRSFRAVKNNTVRVAT